MHVPFVLDQEVFMKVRLVSISADGRAKYATDCVSVSGTSLSQLIIVTHSVAMPKLQPMAVHPVEASRQNRFHIFFLITEQA